MAFIKGFTFNTGTKIQVPHPSTGKMSEGEIKGHYWYGHKEGATEPYTLRSLMEKYVEVEVEGKRALYNRDLLLKLRREAKSVAAGTKSESSSSGTWSGVISGFEPSFQSQ